MDVPDRGFRPSNPHPDRHRADTDPVAPPTIHLRGRHVAGIMVTDGNGVRRQTGKPASNRKQQEDPRRIARQNQALNASGMTLFDLFHVKSPPRDLGAFSAIDYTDGHRLHRNLDR